jgi:hypothetical protein
MALAAGLYAGPVAGVKTVPEVGGWQPRDGVTCPAAFAMTATRPRILLIFYRSYLTAADLDPIEALHAGLSGAGFDVVGLFAPSLKAPGVAGWLRRDRLFRPRRGRQLAARRGGGTGVPGRAGDVGPRRLGGGDARVVPR